MRTPTDAVAYAADLASSGSSEWHDKCLYFVRTCYAVAGKYSSAAIAWIHTTKRGTGGAPFGAPHWWTGGSAGFGHVTIDAGSGYCYSSDFGPNGYVGDGKIRKVPVTAISAHVPNLVYRGWSRDLNDVQVVPESGPIFPNWKVTHKNGSYGIFKPPVPGQSAFPAASSRALEIARTEYWVKLERA